VMEKKRVKKIVKRRKKINELMEFFHFVKNEKS